MGDDLEFAHLHNHTQYSTMDGASPVNLMVARAVELGHRAMGLTDHGTMSGAFGFYKECKAAGINPLVGCEFYMTPIGEPCTARVPYAKEHRGPMDEKPRNNYHLIAFAKDIDGFNNLCELMTYSWSDGFYSKPRIDMDLLQAHSKGVIVSSACILGEVNHWLRQGQYARARDAAVAMRDAFGDDYYLEMMNGGMPDQIRILSEIKRLGKELGIRTIVTNDSHFIGREDKTAQDYMQMLGMGKTVNDPDRMQMGDEYFLKDYAEMEAAVDDPESYSNTLELAEKCHLVIDTDTYHIPVYDVTTDARFGEYCLARGLVGA